MSPRAHRGFALLELVVALAIFSVLALLAYGGLAAIVRARSAGDEAAQRLRSVQLTVAMLERDLRHAASRPVRGSGGETLPALAGSAIALELTRAGFARPDVEARSTLARIGWGADGNRLVRSAYAVLDRAPATKPAPRVLCEDASELRFRYLDRSAAWRDTWPPRDGPERDGESLPRAVEFRFVLRDWGEVVRLVELPDGAAAPPPGPAQAGTP